MQNKLRLKKEVVIVKTILKKQHDNLRHVMRVPKRFALLQLFNTPRENIMNKRT